MCQFYLEFGTDSSTKVHWLWEKIPFFWKRISHHFSVNLKTLMLL